MSDPLTSEAQGREHVSIRNGPGLDDVLSCSQVPPEVRIADRSCGRSKDQEYKKQDHKAVADSIN